MTMVKDNEIDRILKKGKSVSMKKSKKGSMVFKYIEKLPFKEEFKKIMKKQNRLNDEI